MFLLLFPWVLRGIMLIIQGTVANLWIQTYTLFKINLTQKRQFVFHYCQFSFLAHLAFRPCELLSSLFVRCPSINISHFNLFLRNHWANCNQTMVEWFLDGLLPKLCPVILTSNQDGRQAKNRKKGGSNFNCPLLLQCKSK